MKSSSVFAGGPGTDVGSGGGGGDGVGVAAFSDAWNQFITTYFQSTSTQNIQFW